MRQGSVCEPVESLLTVADLFEQRTAERYTDSGVVRYKRDLTGEYADAPVVPVGDDLEAQVLNGDGNAPNLLGVLNVPGIRTYEAGSLSSLVAIREDVAGMISDPTYTPDAVVIHPDDWRRLLQEVGIDDPRPGPLSGLKVVVTEAIASGTALVGAFKLGGILFRRDPGEAALCVFRPDLFCLVTGLSA